MAYLMLERQGIGYFVLLLFQTGKPYPARLLIGAWQLGASRGLIARIGIRAIT